MICKGCGEAYDEELFPVCPFCLTENKKTEVTDYIYHENGTFTLDGKSAKPSIKLVHNSDDEKDTDLFLIKLDEKLN